MANISDEQSVGPPQPPTTSRSAFQRRHVIFLSIAVAYFAFVFSLAVPELQRNLIFLNKVRLPIGADYDRPEKYGLSPHKTVNLRIDSTDEVSLGAWFTFSDPYFTSPTFNSSEISDALRTYPTVLYLHGNAATRAFKTRVSIYSAFSSRLHTNVLAIDYRGFGDSTGAPTEEGTIQDATAAFDWLVSHGADPQNILVVGHSLGTGIGAQMTARLDRERGVRVRGVVLMSGFTSIEVAMESFVLLGLPILAPMRFIPGAWPLLVKLAETKFYTLNHISDIKSPLMLVHAKDDGEIPSFHSMVLFDKLLEPLLPTAPPAFKSLPYTIPEVEFEAIRTKHVEYNHLRDELVRTTRTKEDAFVKYEFDREGGIKTILIETLWGGHDRMALQEGVQDMLKEVFRLGQRLR